MAGVCLQQLSPSWRDDVLSGSGSSLERRSDAAITGNAMALQKRLWVAMFALQGAAWGQSLTDLFDDSVLHEVRISMPAANWQGLRDHYLDNTYFNVDSLQWTGAGGNTLTVTKLAVR